eukprot:12001837-Alexandrium_andersonii.AAC.1
MADEALRKTILDHITETFGVDAVCLGGESFVGDPSLKSALAPATFGIAQDQENYGFELNCTGTVRFNSLGARKVFIGRFTALG